MQSIIDVFLSILGIYFFLGLLFALYFVFRGAIKLDPLMSNTKNKVRFLLFPGVIATWPFLAVKLFNQKKS